MAEKGKRKFTMSEFHFCFQFWAQHRAGLVIIVHFSLLLFFRLKKISTDKIGQWENSCFFRDNRGDGGCCCIECEDVFMLPQNSKVAKKKY